MQKSFDMKSTWAKRQLIEFLERGDSSAYQKIQFTHDQSDKDVSRKETCRKIFDEDLTGKTILNVGCNLGYLCFEALNRGAKRAVGVDINSDRIRQARLLADRLGPHAQFYTMDIEKELPNEVFDIVICLNLLHRLKNPFYVLDQLISATREKLLLELDGPESHTAAKYLKVLGIPWWQRRGLEKLPVIVVGRNGTSSRYLESKFFVSRQAMGNLLLNHRRYFAQVDMIESEFRGRYIVIANRLRINRLIVVAGPGASGKSTFINRLKRGDIPAITNQLVLGDVSSWKFASSNRFPHMDGAYIDKLILHYDFQRPWRRDARIHERDEALHLLKAANEITFITAWAEPEQLRRRVEARIIQLSRKKRYIDWKKLKSLVLRTDRSHFSKLSFKRSKNLIKEVFGGGPNSHALDVHLKVQRQLDRLYKGPSSVLDQYQRWFEFCASYNPKAQWIVDTTQVSPKVYPVSEWTSRVSSRLRE